MRPRFHRAIFLALLAIPIAWACGREVTIPDLPDEDASTIDAAAETSTFDANVSDGGSDDAADVVCPLVLPDDANGAFVTTTGMDSASCGTKATPCKTVTFGVGRAKALGKSLLNVARGTYVERITLSAGLEIIGGWDVAGTSWQRTCTSPEDATLLRAPSTSSVTVEARDIAGEARLTLVRIESKATNQTDAGESLYGVVAVGATTNLVLTNVKIEVGEAGDGVNGRNGDAGAPAPGSCAVGTGATGTMGARGVGAPAGWFGATGYVAGDAGAGASGDAGENGTAGAMGGCVQCGTCGDFLDGCPFTPVGAPSCGKDGTNGCGGGGGSPGGPGTSGGSSIGLYAWDAIVTINGGRIRSGDGGNGGGGGAGGSAGVGSKGQPGASAAPCIVKCDVGAMACVPIVAQGDGGAAGGDGGAGGTGGTGGGGSGGSSFAIYQGGAGIVTTSGGTSLAHGKAGAGGGPDGGAGAAGMAALRVP